VEIVYVVTAVIADDKTRKITIRIEYGREEPPLVCPVCGEKAKLYDHRILKGWFGG
jgi:hypothetical protein